MNDYYYDLSGYYSDGIKEIFLFLIGVVTYVSSNISFYFCLSKALYNILFYSAKSEI